MKKIDQKIVDYRVELSGKPAPKKEPVAEKAVPARETSDDGKVVRMHEKLERPPQQHQVRHRPSRDPS